MKAVIRFLAVAIICAMCWTSGPAMAGSSSLHKTELTWYGQSAFKLVTPKGHVLYLDPWLLNPVNKTGPQDLEKASKADLILVTHGHFDHVGQAVEIAQKTHARLVTTYDLGNALATYAGYPKDQMGFDTLGNTGGVLTFFEGEIKVALIPAYHSSSVQDADKVNHAAGQAGGFVVMVKDGPTIYHTGDTDVFNDMALVSQYGKIDLMLACIGDHFTMGPDRAALAVKLVNPAHVAPMHFGTFVPVMTGTVPAFKQALAAKGLGQKLLVLHVHQPVNL